MQIELSLTIRIESVPKHAPANTEATNETMTFTELEKAREYVERKRIHHQKNSAWFKIYNAKDECVFNSKLIRT